MVLVRVGARRRRARDAWRFAGAALVSLFAPAGCFDAAPEYAGPHRSAPITYSMLAVPGVTTMSIVDPREASIEFDVPFRANDAGTNLQAIFVLDYDAREGLDLVGLPVPVDASAVLVDEQPLRNVSFSWAPVGNKRPGAGYHSLTMILTYADNMDLFYRNAQWDPDLLATQTWWFYFLPANGENAMSCPTPL